MSIPDESLLDQLRQIVGSPHVLLPADREPPGYDEITERGIATVRPSNTLELSKVMACLSKAERSIVPIGGATGLVDGCVTNTGDVLISTERMKNIEVVDPEQRTITVGAGAPLQLVQDAVASVNLNFPLDLGARGSATIGGAIATNAGGNRVIRFGMMRDLVLGLEVVLADGRIVSSMNTLLKNNTGYDLKQLFIGSEGTLGIVTRAVLRLWPAQAERQMAFIGLSEVESVGDLLLKLNQAAQGNLTAFEAMWPRFYEIACSDLANTRRPLAGEHPLYVLVEVQGDCAAREALETCLGSAIEGGLIEDVVIAQSERDCQTFWTIRDNVEPIGQYGDLAMFDVGLPLKALVKYAEQVKQDLLELVAVNEAVIWGHIGDGNLHIWVACSALTDELRKKINDIVYNPLQRLGGSISAEHGIGLEKRDYLSISRSESEIELMSILKTALDPHNRLNPGKLLPAMPKVRPTA